TARTRRQGARGAPSRRRLARHRHRRGRGGDDRVPHGPPAQAFAATPRLPHGSGTHEAYLGDDPRRPAFARRPRDPRDRRPCGGLSLIGITVILLVLDLPLALVTLSVYPILFFFTRWFRNRSEVLYRRVREAVTLVYIQFTETLGGVRAVHAFRREPRNEEI